MSLYSWPNIVSSLVCGLLVDKLGIRRILSLSWIITVAGLAVILYSTVQQRYLIIAIGRVVVGIGNEALSLTVKLYLIQFFHSKDYSIVFAVYLVCVSLGARFN